MIQITDFHDTASITAVAAMENQLRAAAHEVVLAEVRSGRHYRRIHIAGIGHLLVRLGTWLKEVATPPAMMEETVQ